MYCRYCGKDISVAAGEINGLKRHATMMVHTKNEKSVNQQSSISHIFLPAIDQQICKAELKFAYILAEHAAK